MTGVIAACWQDDCEKRAQTVLNDAESAFCDLRGAEKVTTAQSDNLCLTAFVGIDDDEAPLYGPSGTQPYLAYAGWVGMWENGRGFPVTARQIAERYATSAVGTLSNLFGHYGLVIADPRSQELVATVDHPGLFPLYYAHEPGIVWVSSSALCLAKALNRKFESRAALALFLAAQVRSPWSAFDGIRRLRIGERLTVTRGRPRSESTWNPFIKTADYNGIKECAEYGAELLTNACHAIEASCKRPIFDLTGGLDSRVVVGCSSAASNVLDVTVTGTLNNLDVQISKNIAHELGWRWHYIPTPHCWNGHRWDFFRKAVFLNDGELPAHPADDVLLCKSKLSENFDMAITGGLGGSILRDHNWSQELTGIGKTPRLNLERFFRYRFSPNFSKIPPGLFDDDLLPEYVSSELATANDLVSQEPDSLNTAKLDVLSIWKNSGHVGRYTGSSAAVLTSLSPIGLRPIIEFGLSVPFRYRLRGKLIRHMISAQNSALAAFPTTYGGSAEPYSAFRPDRYIRHGIYFVSRAIRKARQIAAQRGVILGDPETNGARAEDEVFRSHLEDLGYLNASSLISASLYRAEGLESLLQSARRGEPTSAGPLYALASVELICRTLESHVSSKTPNR